MAKFDKDTIQNLMLLSRIECTEEQQEALLNDLKKIIEYFEQLNEIDTQDIVPCDHVLADIYNVMRDDHVGETMPRQKFLDNAAAHIGGMIKVPTIIKQK